jgi:hypothetical protein
MAATKKAARKSPAKKAAPKKAVVGKRAAAKRPVTAKAKRAAAGGEEGLVYSDVRREMRTRLWGRLLGA